MYPSKLIHTRYLPSITSGTIKLHPKSGKLDLNNSIYYSETEKSIGKRLDSNTYSFRIKDKSARKKKLIIKTKPYEGIMISEIYQ